MKKRLITLGIAGLLAGGPNAHAEIDSTKSETNKELSEAISNQSTNSEKSKDTISFEDAKKLKDNKELLENLLANEKIQELITEYGEEDVKTIINEILKNGDVDKIIDKAMNNEDLQKAMEEGDNEEVAKILQETIEDFYKVRPAWWRITDKISFGITFIIAWELLKKRKEY